MALLTAKRSHQPVLVYTDDMATATADPTEDERHTQMLAAALARAVDAKDSYTRSHSHTVAQLSALIAAELGFTGDRLAKVRLAGLLHDVGKIGVPDAILNKPAALTDDEYEIMKQHAVLGFEIVESAGLPEQGRWVRHHHERVDGRGYPDGLRGEEIPLESRIILVADSFEAMTSDRPYRRAPAGNSRSPSWIATPAPSSIPTSSRRSPARSTWPPRPTSSPRPCCRSPRGEDRFPATAPEPGCSLPPRRASRCTCCAS